MINNIELLSRPLRRPSHCRRTRPCPPAPLGLLCSCFAPPYLFVVVHLIILVLWKLSDPKHHHGEPAPVEEKLPETTDAVEIKSFESPPAVPLLPQILPSPATAKPMDPDSAGSQLSDGDLVDEEAENDSMEATWKAIIEKTPRGAENPGPRPPPPPPPPPRFHLILSKSIPFNFEADIFEIDQNRIEI